MNRIRTYVLIATVGLIAAGIIFYLQRPQDHPTETTSVTIGYSALRISLPVFIAQEKGFFKNEGLDVKLERYDTAQPLADALVAGRIQAGGYTALPITLTAMQRGNTNLYFSTAMVEDSQHRISYFIVPKDAPDGYSLKDLKGKKIGILPTVAYRSWLVTILKNAGLAEGDVEIVQIAPNLELTALQSHQIDALFTNDPVATTVIQKNIGKLMSNRTETVETFGEPFIFGSFNIRKDYADAHPDTTRKVVRALDSATEYINSHPQESKKYMESYLDESQRPFVQAYPDALYQSSKTTDPVKFQDTVDSYLQHAIIQQGVDIKPLLITENFGK